MPKSSCIVGDPIFNKPQRCRVPLSSWRMFSSKSNLARWGEKFDTGSLAVHEYKRTPLLFTKLLGLCVKLDLKVCQWNHVSQATYYYSSANEHSFFVSIFIYKHAAVGAYNKFHSIQEHWVARFPRNSSHPVLIRNAHHFIVYEEDARKSQETNMSGSWNINLFRDA